VKDLRDSWDRLYQVKGRLWGGSPRPLPDLPTGTRVLDLGSGNGSAIGSMIDRQWQIIAIDCSPAAIGFSRQVKDAGSVDGFIVADAERLPFRDSSFDAIFCNHLLGHLFLTGRVLCAEEATRVLRNNGQIFFAGFATDDMRAGRGMIVEPGTVLRGGGIITHYFSPEEVPGLFPLLTPVRIERHQWYMRIHGEDLRRSEIVATFKKEPKSFGMLEGLEDN
jgi:ubiquinone/menaquinone biosynthesis C-methylase UbiE